MNTKIRLYFSDKIQSDLVAHIKKEQSHYLKDVMRLKEGDKFSVFNNQGEWNASVENHEKLGTKIRILEKYGSPILALSATSKELSKIPGLGEIRAKKIKKMLEHKSQHKKTSNQKTLHD